MALPENEHKFQPFEDVSAIKNGAMSCYFSSGYTP